MNLGAFFYTGQWCFPRVPWQELWLVECWMLKVLPTLHHPCPLHKLFITISLMGQKTRKKKTNFGVFICSLSELVSQVRNVWSNNSKFISNWNKWKKASKSTGCCCSAGRAFLQSFSYLPQYKFLFVCFSLSHTGLKQIKRIGELKSCHSDQQWSLVIGHLHPDSAMWNGLDLRTTWSIFCLKLF